MEKEVIIALLGDISNDIKIDLLKSEDMLSNDIKERIKDKIVDYIEDIRYGDGNEDF